MSFDRRNELIGVISRERSLKELAAASGIDDHDLVVRLHDAGFDAESLPALMLAPIAMVAWGSGYVSEYESRVASHAIFHSEVSEHPAAMSVLRDWLQERPDKSLMTLWHDFATARLSRVSPSTKAEILDRRHSQAKEVALASGGILGFGSICDGEQLVLDQIQSLRE
jgi:DNA polymerase III epsilon subunit-like protein